jgi:hypothetical protein
MSTKKPYCKICHDAGKPEKEYNNHWVKDLNGKTICPTLLNTQCRYCFKMGHTTKFCAVLAKNNKEKENKTTNKKSLSLIMKKPVFQNKPTNGFAVLCNDDDEEEITNMVLGLKEKTSWSSIAATKPIEIIQPMEEKKVSRPIQSKSWADWSDSEDEEDDEYDNDLHEVDCVEEIAYDAW